MLWPELFLMALVVWVLASSGSCRHVNDGDPSIHITIRGCDAAR